MTRALGERLSGSILFASCTGKRLRPNTFGTASCNASPSVIARTSCATRAEWSARLIDPGTKTAASTRRVGDCGDWRGSANGERADAVSALFDSEEFSAPAASSQPCAGSVIVAMLSDGSGMPHCCLPPHQLNFQCRGVPIKTGARV